MEAWKKVVVYVACTGLVVAGLPGFVLPIAAQQAAGAEQRESPAAKPLLAANDVNSAMASELPDSPGATWSKSGIAMNHGAAVSRFSFIVPAGAVTVCAATVRSPGAAFSPKAGGHGCGGSSQRKWNCSVATRGCGNSAHETAPGAHDRDKDGSDCRSGCGCGIGRRADRSYFE